MVRQGALRANPQSCEARPNLGGTYPPASQAPDDVSATDCRVNPEILSGHGRPQYTARHVYASANCLAKFGGLVRAIVSFSQGLHV